MTTPVQGAGNSQQNPWRVGRHFPIHVYDGDTPVATFHTAADAWRAVAAVNGVLSAASAVAREREIRERVAVEIEAARPNTLTPGSEFRDVVRRRALDDAAAIARGSA